MKAVIQTGGKQYTVSKGDKLNVELIDDKKSVSFDVLMLVDGAKSKVGNPTVKGATVKAKVIDHVRDDKVTAIRYKSKKRVHKRRGHKQPKAVIEITSIDV